MGEVYAWPEGALYVWTGTGAASALVTFATDTRADIDYGMDNYRTLDGVYHNQSTGQRIDISIGTLFAPDAAALQTMADAKTAVHFHFKHTNPAGGSAGYLIYSGSIDRVSLFGTERGLAKLNVSCHANGWTSYNQ
jgi:hypothetical protein